MRAAHTKLAQVFLAVMAVSLCRAAQVTLAWDPSPDVGIGSYRVWHFDADGNIGVTNAGLSTMLTVDGLEEGKNYRFAVSAVGTNQLESATSNQVLWRSTPPPDDTNHPAPPVIHGSSAVKVSIKIPTSTNYPPTWEGVATAWMWATNDLQVWEGDELHPVSIEQFNIIE